MAEVNDVIANMENAMLRTCLATCDSGLFMPEKLGKAIASQSHEATEIRMAMEAQTFNFKRFSLPLLHVSRFLGLIFYNPRVSYFPVRSGKQPPFRIKCLLKETDN